MQFEVPSLCPQLPDDCWTKIIDYFTEKHGLRAAKMLRKYARISRIFSRRAREHPDNNPPPMILDWGAVLRSSLPDMAD